MKLLRKKERVLDPSVKADLESVDAALAGHGGEERDDLGGLALELRADRPVPRDEFLAALDERVVEGFPSPSRDGGDQTSSADTPSGRPPITWAGLRRVVTPVAAGGAALAVAAVGITTSGVLSNATTDQGLQLSQAEDGALREQAPSAKQVAPEAAGDALGKRSDLASPPTSAVVPEEPSLKSIAPSRGRSSDAQRTRQQVSNARLTLGAAPGEIEEVADGAIRIADRYKGFVASSQVTSGDGTQGGASIELRIPSANVADAIADLSKLGHVIERNQGSEDVTGEFISLRARLTNATKERQSLLRQLDVADTSQETARVRARLRSADARISRLRAQQRRLSAEVNFSTVVVTVQRDENAGKGDGKFTPGDALRDARDILGAALGAIVIGLAVLIPASVLIALVWLGARGIRRRQREQALDVEPQPGPDSSDR